MQRDAKGADQQECRQCPKTGGQQKTGIGRAKGDDDEHDFDAFDHRDLKRRKQAGAMAAIRAGAQRSKPLGLSGMCGLLVAQGDHPGGAQHCLSQPAEAENE